MWIILQEKEMRCVCNCRLLHDESDKYRELIYGSKKESKQSLRYMYLQCASMAVATIATALCGVLATVVQATCLPCLIA